MAQPISGKENKELDKYLIWFKIKRIKERLGYLSPTEYRSRASL